MRDELGNLAKQLGFKILENTHVYQTDPTNCGSYIALAMKYELEGRQISPDTWQTGPGWINERKQELAQKLVDRHPYFKLSYLLGIPENKLPEDFSTAIKDPDLADPIFEFLKKPDLAKLGNIQIELGNDSATVNFLKALHTRTYLSNTQFHTDGAGFGLGYDDNIQSGPHDRYREQLKSYQPSAELGQKIRQAFNNQAFYIREAQWPEPTSFAFWQKDPGSKFKAIRVLGFADQVPGQELKIEHGSVELDLSSLGELTNEQSERIAQVIQYMAQSGPNENGAKELLKNFSEENKKTTIIEGIKNFHEQCEKKIREVHQKLFGSSSAEEQDEIF